jgi:hypothetical protein
LAAKNSSFSRRGLRVSEGGGLETPQKARANVSPKNCFTNLDEIKMQDWVYYFEK